MTLNKELHKEKVETFQRLEAMHLTQERWIQ